MNFKKSDAWVKYFQLNRTLHLCLKKQKFKKKKHHTKPNKKHKYKNYSSY